MYYRNQAFRGLHMWCTIIGRFAATTSYLFYQIYFQVQILCQYDISFGNLTRILEIKLSLGLIDIKELSP